MSDKTTKTPIIKITSDETFFEALDQNAMLKADKELLEARYAKSKVKFDLAFQSKISEQKSIVDKQHKALAKYALLHRTRLMGDAKKLKTNVSEYGFEDCPTKVVPIVKATDETLVNQLLTMPNDKGKEYLTVTYTLDKSKIGDSIVAGVKWICAIFKRTKSIKFVVSRRKDLNK